VTEKSAHAAELERIRTEYERRDREIPSDFYALYHPANLFVRHSQEEAVLAGLHAAGLTPLTGRRVLDVGCGVGDWFGLFERFGAGRADLAGIELGESRAAEARLRFPAADIRQGDAAELPWPDRRFDVVFQSTLLTSVLNEEVRGRIACEMLRVLAPNGAIVWLDFRYNNPSNPNVRGIGRSELARLFPQCDVRLRRIVLAPPLARRIVPWSIRLARLLEMTTLFNTHYLAVIRRA
jgi:ubiquinone/menaquinone biosynthesis C-methylase UbiE